LLLFQSTRVHASAMRGAARIAPAAAAAMTAVLRLKKIFVVGVALGMRASPDCRRRAPTLSAKALYVDETNSFKLSL
jgi:hypothetical protein